MLVLSILFLIASNAVVIKRDMSILYNRIAILILIYSISQQKTNPDGLVFILFKVEFHT